MISSSIKIWSRRKRMGSDVDNGGRLDYVITYSCSVIPYLRPYYTIAYHIHVLSFPICDATEPETETDQQLARLVKHDWEVSFQFYSSWRLPVQMLFNGIHVFVSSRAADQRLLCRVACEGFVNKQTWQGEGSSLHLFRFWWSCRCCTLYDSLSFMWTASIIILNDFHILISCSHTHTNTQLEVLDFVKVKDIIVYLKRHL